MNPRSRQFTEQALAHHQAGRLQQALPLYQQAIAADKSNSDAHQFMGLLYLHTGQPDQGIACIRNAIAINPNAAPYHDNLGAALESVGDNAGALSSFQIASTLDQDNADRLFGMGNALAALGHSAEAEKAYRSAIGLNPEDSGFHFNLGNLLKSRGELNAACECYRHASERQPAIEGVLANWGNTLVALRDYSQAIDIFERSVGQNPKNTEVLTALVSALLHVGETTHAKKWMDQAVKSLPVGAVHAAVTVFNQKGKLALQTRNYRDAISAYRKVLKVEQDNQEAVSGLAATFRWIQPRGYDPALASDILWLFDQSGVAHQRFSRLVANQVRHQLRSALQKIKLSEKAENVIFEIANSSLLTAYLSRLINTDAELEQDLIAVRRMILEMAVSSLEVSTEIGGLASALAVQMFLNEHVYVTGSEEHAMLSELAAEMESSGVTAASAVFSATTEFAISVCAMFEPLYRSAYRSSLLQPDLKNVSPEFFNLIQLTLVEPKEEAQIKLQIESLGQIADSVSSAVRAQYEQHPYPRWFNLVAKSKVSYYDYLDTVFPYYTPPQVLSSEVSVLSAGCGTGQEAAMIARGRVAKEVIGLDLSATSLAHAQRMANKMQLQNLQFIQGDILNVSELARTFPVIETTGVLHHMGDPVAGWQSLVDCLDAQGVMKVGLYSARASIEVNNAREWIQQQGYASDSETIKSVRQQILSMSADNRLYALRYSEDFYSVSACRDLIFHVQEQSYTPAELQSMLSQLNMEFIGFELPDETTRQQYLSMFPSDKSMTNLENWDQYDEKYPDTFSGMLVFWCQRR